MALYTKRTVHDVAFGSNLDLILRAFNGVANRFVDAVGGGLQAIALALATPQDNSTEVQKHLDALNDKLKASNAALQAAIDKQKGK